MIATEEALYDWCKSTDGPLPIDISSTLSEDFVTFVVNYVHSKSGAFLVSSSTSKVTGSLFPAQNEAGPSAGNTAISEPAAVSYEESFPPLSVKNSAGGPPTSRSITAVSKKRKKRIRSTPVETSTAHSGNIARLPSSNEQVQLIHTGYTAGVTEVPSSPPRCESSQQLTTPPKDNFTKLEIVGPGEPGEMESRPQVSPTSPTTVLTAQRRAQDGQAEITKQIQRYHNSRLEAVLSPSSNATTGAMLHLGSPLAKPHRSPTSAVKVMMSPSASFTNNCNFTSDINLRSLDAYTLPTEDARPVTHVKHLLNLAKLYGCLIAYQLVDRANEIVYLFRLLRCSSAHLSETNSNTSSSLKQNVFFNGTLDCTAFAAHALAAARPLLQHLDIGILILLIEDPILLKLVRPFEYSRCRFHDNYFQASRMQVPDSIVRLRHIIDVHRHRALGLSRQPGTMPRNLRIGGGPNHDFALPFREETDSRHHFRYILSVNAYKCPLHS